MKRTALLCAAAVLVCLPAMKVTGSPNREEENAPAVQRITITGMLRLVGNEPFTRFSLRTEEGTDYILEDVPREEWTRQLGRKVTIAGILEIRTMKSADETMTFTENIILRAELLE